MQSKYNIFIPDLMTKTSQTDTPKVCLKNMQTAFVSYVFFFNCYMHLKTINATSVKIIVHA